MRHRVKRIRWPVLVLAGVVVAGSGTAYAVTNDGSGGHYRTVRATKGDVEQVLATDGTVDAAHRADLEFATSGTVADVSVALGDTVRAGQVVARLDTAELDAAVTRARASLARAEAQLESDENAQAQAVSDAASASAPQASTPKPSAPKPTATPSSTGADPATTAALADLEAQQDAVVQAQGVASAAVAAATDALADQVDACADAYQDPAADATGSPDAGEQDPTAGDACSAALAEVQAKQAAVGDAQDALADALAALADTLSKALAALSSSGGSSSPSSGGASTPSAGTTTPSSSSGGSTTPTSSGDAASGTVSAAQLASDQAAIEQARADLVEARQERRQAVVRSTRPGRVVSLGIAKGDDVSAGDVAAVVVGGKAVTIQTTVEESKIAEVEVGQRVRVTTPGGSDSTEGTVTAIGMVADSSSGTASYPVTVTVEDPTIALPAGSQALLEIVVATARDVVTVPTSAVTRRGDGAVVRTWDGTTLSTKAVTLGTVGAREVEITQGLSVGDAVVLADIDEEINGASDRINDRGGYNAPVFRMDRGGAGGGPPVTYKSGG